MKVKNYFYYALVLVLGVSGCTSKKEIVTDPQPQAEIFEDYQVTAKAPPAPRTAPPAESALKTPTDIPADAPIFTFKETTHDFGSIGPGSSHTCEFTFTNTGKSVLKIDRTHAPCGCTIPEMAKKEYDPGESGTMKVRLNAPTAGGPLQKSIYLYSNDPRNPQLELKLKAEIEVNVSVTPDKVKLMLDQDNAGMPDLTVISKDNKDFAITKITVTGEIMDIPFDSSKSANKFVLEPKILKEKADTARNGTIQIHTDHPKSGVLLVHYEVKPLFEVSRPRIILQNVAPGEEIVRDVLIKSNYGKKVEIESSSSANGYMTIESQKEDGNGLQIMVTIQLPSEATAANRRYVTDELTIKLKDGHELSIRCSGWFKLK